MYSFGSSSDRELLFKSTVVINNYCSYLLDQKVASYRSFTSRPARQMYKQDDPVAVTSSICSNSVHLQVCILISAPKSGYFQSHPHITEENKNKAENCKLIFPKVVQRHCVGEVGKSI